MSDHQLSQDELESAELGRVRMTVAKAWRGARRRFSALLPGWPVLLSAVLAVAALFGTGQGRQATGAVLSSSWSAPLIASFVTIFLHGVIIQGAFLSATRFQEDFFGETLRLHRFQRGSAVVASLILPVALLLFMWFGLGGETAGGRQIASMALWAGLGLIAVVFVVNMLLIKFYYRICENSFGQIVAIDGRYIRCISGLILLGWAVGVALNLWKPLIAWMGPVSITVLALTLIGAALGWFVSILRRYKMPPLVFFLAVMAFLSAISATQFDSRYHDLKVVDARPQTGALPSARDYARQWLAAKAPAGSRGDIHAVVVLAEGGGIFAARNAGGMLTRLDAQTCGDLYNDLYVMSGVSGGSVGLATYLAARADKLSPDSDACGDSERLQQTTAVVHDFLGKDFLSPILTGLLFRDLPYRVIPFIDVLSYSPSRGIPDRAQLFEAEFSRQWKVACGDGCASGRDATVISPFDEDFAKVAASARRGAKGGRGPVVIFNATRIESGGVEIVSNVTFDRIGADGAGSDKTPAVPYYNILDRLVAPADGADGDRRVRPALPLATAAHVSARFPIVSPTAMISKRPDRQRERFVDGGYVDNSGALSALRAVDELYLAAHDIDEAPGGCRGERSSPSPGPATGAGAACISDRLKITVLHFYSRKIAKLDGFDEKGANREVTPLGLEPAGTNWFEEVVNPLLAVVKARQARGQSAVDALCRSAVAGAGATEQAKCRDLSAHRAAVRPTCEVPPKDEAATGGRCATENGASGRWVTPGGAERDDQAVNRLNAGLNWVNAPIDIGEDAQSDNFVPLGWYLGRASNAYMSAEEERRAKAVCRKLGVLTGKIAEDSSENADENWRRCAYGENEPA